MTHTAHTGRVQAHSAAQGLVEAKPHQPCFYKGKTVHVRAAPKRHRLSQTLLCLYVDVQALDQGSRLAGGLVGLNKFAPISLHASDFGPIGSTQNPTDSVQNGKSAADPDTQTNHSLFARLNGILARTHTPPAAHFYMLALPRVLGYCFRPLTIFYGFTADGALSHIIYEVNNTFSERHHYVADVTALGRDNTEDMHTTPANTRAVNAQVATTRASNTRASNTQASNTQAAYTHAADKVFYVSPFQAVGGTYRFLSSVPGDTLKVKIFADDGAGGKLTASLTGARRAVTRNAALKAICLRPFGALKVTVGIHWHALLLWRKGLKFYKHKSTQSSGASKTYS